MQHPSNVGSQVKLFSYLIRKSEKISQGGERRKLSEHISQLILKLIVTKISTFSKKKEKELALHL
jgi:hypothetical protein